MNQDERIERYILNKMDDEEANEFEAYFLSNQACIEQLEIAEKLHIGLKALQEKSDENVLCFQSKKRAWWQAQLPLIPAVAAMFLLIAMPSIFLISQNSGPKSVEVFEIELAGLRSSSYEVNEATRAIEVTRTKEQLLLSIYVDYQLYDDKFSSFEFVMTNQQAEIVFQASDLQINDSSTVFVNLGTQKLPKQTLQFEFSGTRENGHTLALTSGDIIFKQKEN